MTATALLARLFLGRSDGQPPESSPRALEWLASTISKGFNDSLSIAIGAMEEIMAAKTPSVKRYVVRLSAEERQQLER